MATPSKPNLAAPQGQLSAEFVSTLALMLHPDYQREVIKNYGLDDVVKEFLLKEVGKMVKTEYLSGTWAEIGSDFKESIVASVVATAGTDVLVTYSTADMYTIGGIPQSPFNLNDDIMVANPNGGKPVKGKIINKNITGAQHIITIRPYNATQDLVAAIGVGSTILYSGRTVGEASIKGQGVVRDITSYSNAMAVLRNDYTTTDLGKKQPAWFTFADSNGSVGDYYSNYVDQINSMKFLQNVVMATMIGEESDLDIASAEGTTRAVRGTQGYLTQIENRGQLVPYAVAPNIMDLYEIADIARDEGVMGEMDAKMGAAFYNSMEQSIARDFDNGSIVYKKDRDKVMDLRIGDFHLGGYHFKFQNYDMFNHKEMLGNETLGYRDTAIFCPTDKRTDTQTGKKMDSMHMRYKVPQGAGAGGRVAGITKPFFKAWTYGGVAMTNQTGDEIETVSYKALIEPRLMGAGRFIKSFKQ